MSTFYAYFGIPPKTFLGFLQLFHQPPVVIFAGLGFEDRRLQLLDLFLHTNERLRP